MRRIREFLAAIDLETVDVTNKDDTVTIEKADRGTEVKKHRFVNKTLELQCSPVKLSIGLLQLAITWYKIGHAGGQAHYYSRYGTLKQRDLNQ